MRDRRTAGPIRRFLRISAAEGALTQAANSLSGPGSVFLTKFALFLGAGPVHFGLLAAMGQLSQLFQPLGLRLTRNAPSRRRVILALLYPARALLLLLLPLPFLLPHRAALWAFLGLFLLSASLQAVALNAWTAWVSDTVPLRFRGRFFSVRSQFALVAALIAGFGLSLVLDLFEPRLRILASLREHLGGDQGPFAADNLVWGFVVTFLLAAAAGFAANLVLSRQPERPKAPEPEPFLLSLRRPLADPNFRRLLLYGLWWMAAVGIGAPFWQPFMMEKLRMSLAEMQLYGLVSVVSSLLVLRLWGRVVDGFGNRTAMRLAVGLSGLNALVWLFVSRESYFPVFLEAASSGVMWSGAGLVATNFVLSVAPPSQRQMYAGLFAAFTGAGMMVTMLASGFLLPPGIRIAGLPLEPEQVLFALSALARWSTQIPLTLVREPRARPVGAALYFLFHGAKLRVMHAGHFFRHLGRPDRSNGPGTPQPPLATS